MGWTPENIDRIRAMAGDGLSASQIAGQIGGISRNAIVGVGFRHGITFHGGPGGGRPAGSGVPLARKPAVDPTTPVQTVPRMVTFDDLQHGECRYPFGNRDFTFCALPVLEGGSYCRQHMTITRQPR